MKRLIASGIVVLVALCSVTSYGCGSSISPQEQTSYDYVSGHAADLKGLYNEISAGIGAGGASPTVAVSQLGSAYRHWQALDADWKVRKRAGGQAAPAEEAYVQALTHLQALSKYVLGVATGGPFDYDYCDALDRGTRLSIASVQEEIARFQ